MPKSTTLAALANASKKGNNLKTVSQSEIMNQFKKAGVAINKEEEKTEPPIISDAFNGLFNTIAKKKQAIVEANEKIKENYEEMKNEEELGIANYGLGFAPEGTPEATMEEVVEAEKTEAENKIDTNMNDYNIASEAQVDKTPEHHEDDKEEVQLLTNTTNESIFPPDDVFAELDDEPIEEEHKSENEASINDYNISTDEEPDEVEVKESPEPEDKKEEIKEEPIEDTRPSIDDLIAEEETKPEVHTIDNKDVSINKPTATFTVPESEYDDGGENLDKLIADIDRASGERTDDGSEPVEEVRAKIEKFFNTKGRVNKDPIDLKKFTIRRKPVSSSFILNSLQKNSTLKKADWVLFATGRPMRFIECSGPEIDTLRNNMTSGNDINRVIESLKFLYNHVDDANKPSFEAWCKLIRNEDIDSAYFGIYRACYANNNWITRLCPKCNKTSLIETDINAMVKYGGDNDDHDEIKAQFNKILHGDTTTANDSLKSNLMQLSDDIVVSYSPGTLYSTFIQYATLNNDITNKYAEFLNNMAYVDNFFYIDRKTHELIPIEIKEYPNNLNKTVLSKLKVFTTICRSLTNDQYNYFLSKLSDVLFRDSKITYVYPKARCPECGAEIPEQPSEGAMNLLFLRATLARVRNL